MKREVKIGIFAVAMIGVAWAGIRFLKGFDIFSRNVEYYAAYDQINGVQNASPGNRHAAAPHSKPCRRSSSIRSSRRKATRSKAAERTPSPATR